MLEGQTSLWGGGGGGGGGVPGRECLRSRGLGCCQTSLWGGALVESV